MDLFDVGLILKSVKTGLLGIAAIILIIQMVKTKNKLVREAMLLCIIFISLGFILNLIEVTVIPKSLTLVFPATGPYDRGRFARLIIWGFLGLSWAVLLIRLIIFRRNRSILGGSSTNSGSEYHSSPPVLYRRFTGIVPSERSKRGSLQISPSPQVNVLFMIIASLTLMILIIIRNSVKLFLGSYDLIWSIFEILELLLWVITAFPMVIFREKAQIRKQQHT